MKKYLLPSIFLALASLAYAGGSCCDKGGEKTDQEKGASKHVESAVLVAGSSCGDSCDKDGKKTDKSSAYEASAQFAGSGCGDSCGGDKKDKSGKSELGIGAELLADSGCSGDIDGKKCDDKELWSQVPTLA